MGRSAEYNRHIMERGGRWEMSSFDRRRNPEDPWGRGIEATRYGIEGAAEREGSWIAGIINPAKLERIRRMPAYEGKSTDGIIMEALLATLIEKSQEWDRHLRARLRNLVVAFRILSYPNLTDAERETVNEIASYGHFRSVSCEVNPELVEDIRWVWSTFDLQVPRFRSELPQAAEEAAEAMANRLGLRDRR